MNLLLNRGVLAALAITLAGCGSLSQPTATSAVSGATTTSPRPAVQTKSIMAHTVTIGTTGVRCFVGKMSTACAATNRPFKDGDHRYWTATLSLTFPTTLEPGFQPGEPIDPSQLGIGDLAMTGGNIGVITAMGDDPKVGVSSREVGIRAIAGGHNDFGGFFRPEPGQQMNPGQPLTIGDWKFTLTGTTLVIDTPNGPYQLDT